jgi:hypothetical protein
MVRREAERENWGFAMYASIRRYRIDTAAISTAELSAKVREGFLPIASALPGFVAYYVVDAGDGLVASISVFDSRTAAEQSNSAAADWVGDNLAAFVTGPPQITAGEVTVKAP